MSGILNFAIDKVKTRLEESCEYGNVGTSERILSVIAGGFIIGMGGKETFQEPYNGVFWNYPRRCFGFKRCHWKLPYQRSHRRKETRSNSY